MTDAMCHLVLAAVVIVANVLTYHGSLQAEQAQQCLYQYSREPPRELSCNPYDSNQLRLECQLLGNTAQLRELRVRWFFVATGTDRAMEVAATSVTNIETRFRSQITITNPMEGGYFCQPFLADGTSLLRSTQTTVFARDLHIILSLPLCGAEPLSVPVARCAQEGVPNIITNVTGGEAFPTETVVTGVDMTVIVPPQMPTPTSTLTVRATPTPPAEAEATPTPELEGPGTVDISDTSLDTPAFPPWVFAIVGVVAVVVLSFVVTCGVMVWWRSRRRTEKPNFSSTRMGSCRPHTALSTTRSTAHLITTTIEAPSHAYTTPTWSPLGGQDGERDSIQQGPENPHISSLSYCYPAGDYFLVVGDNTEVESSDLETNGYEKLTNNSNTHEGRYERVFLPPAGNSPASCHHTRGPPTVVQDGREYHTVDPSRMEKNGNDYTIPSHSRSRVGEQGMRHVAAGEGMAVRQYQGLRIETMDYMSLYMSGNPSQLPPKPGHMLTAGRKHHKNSRAPL